MMTCLGILDLLAMATCFVLFVWQGMLKRNEGIVEFAFGVWWLISLAHTVVGFLWHR